MGLGEKAWESFRDVIRLQDKVQALGQKVEHQQLKIETLNLEVAQLKVAVAILLSQAGIKDIPKLPFSPPEPPGLMGK
jgi:L-rhamnose isomerase